MGQHLKNHIISREEIILYATALYLVNKRLREMIHNNINFDRKHI